MISHVISKILTTPHAIKSREGFSDEAAKVYLIHCRYEGAVEEDNPRPICLGHDEGEVKEEKNGQRFL
jgi:hypothetical protein